MFNYFNCLLLLFLMQRAQRFIPSTWAVARFAQLKMNFNNTITVWNSAQPPPSSSDFFNEPIGDKTIENTRPNMARCCLLMFPFDEALLAVFTPFLPNIIWNLCATASFPRSHHESSRSFDISSTVKLKQRHNAGLTSHTATCIFFPATYQRAALK